MVDEKNFSMLGGHVTEHQRHTAELAHEVMDAYTAELGSDGPGAEREARTTPVMAQLGRMLWEISYKHFPDDDHAAFANLDREARMRDGLLAVSLTTPQQQIQLTWMARWADQSFPQVTMGHKYCAALLATVADPDTLGEIVPPWKAFLVVLPTDMLFIKTEQGNPIALTKLLVHYVKTSSGQMHWNYLAQTDSTLTFWRHGCPTSGLLRTDIAGVWDGASFMLAIDDQEDRVAALLGRLVINICLAMSNPDNVRGPKARNKPRSTGKRREAEAPEIRTFQLGKPITLDCREAIRDYVLHGTKKRNGTTPAVQVLVRGHWKPRLAARVGHPVWIEPYWRGPEDAPILTRPHMLKNEETT